MIYLKVATDHRGGLLPCYVISNGFLCCVNFVIVGIDECYIGWFYNSFVSAEGVRGHHKAQYYLIVTRLFNACVTRKKVFWGRNWIKAATNHRGELLPCYVASDNFLWCVNFIIIGVDQYYTGWFYSSFVSAEGKRGYHKVQYYLIVTPLYMQQKCHDHGRELFE